MKKAKWLVLSTLILAVSMLLALSVGAAENGSLALTDAEGAVGETVTVDLKISSNPGLLTIKVAVSYDEDLELVSVENLNLIAGYVTPSPTITSPYTLFWKDSLSTQNNTQTGSIARLTFKIKDDAELGEKKVSVKLTESRNASSELLAFDSAEAVVNVVDKKTSIKCAQVALGTDISVNYYADILAADKGAQMRFTMNGKETLVDGTFDEEYGLYVFPFTGITPQCMGDTIKAELVKDGEALAVKDDYSVLQNCKNLLGKTAKDLGLTDDQYAAMETLIADLMEYGAAAQTYRRYKTDSLMNKDETIAALKPTEFVKWVGEDAEAVCSWLDDTTDETMYIYAAGVYFDYCNSVYIKFHAEGITAANFCVTTDAEEAWYRLDDEAHPIIPLDEEDNYLVVFEPVPAFELGDDEIFYDIVLNTVKKVKTTEKTTPVQELYYSIPAYVFSKQEETSLMANLAKALYNYGLSAANYMAAIEK